MIRCMGKRTYIDSNGYLRFKDSNTPVHRWVAEKMIGRKLRPKEVVHHKDRDKLNNRPSNLWVCKNQAEHDRIHKLDADRFGASYSYKGHDEDEFEYWDDDFDEEDWDD
jgi:hypothetical protein